MLPAALVSLLLVAGSLAPTPATAQTASVRNFPANALRGTLVVQQPPIVLLNGSADRLSPGSRIHDTNNMLAMSASLVGQSLTVNYVRESAGMIHEVWILTDAEAALKRATASNGSSTTNIITLFNTNTTPRDDGKTPFNQLPVYPNQ